MACSGLRADQLFSRISGFLTKVQAFLTQVNDDEMSWNILESESNLDDEDLLNTLRAKRSHETKIPLPLNFSVDKYKALGACNLIK